MPKTGTIWMIKSLFDKLTKRPLDKSQEASFPKQQLTSLLGFKPHCVDYYQLSLTHKSVSIRNKNGQRISNERLEFLGDAVLETAVSDLLYKHFPTQSEGFLTKMRSKIVQRDCLNELGEKLGLSDLVMTATPENTHHLYGNTLEALIGAIYLDQGFDICKLFIEKRLVFRFLNLDRLAKTEDNYKSQLIEWCQKHQKKIRFEVVSQELEKAIKFHAKVYIDDIEYGIGVGFTKRKSEQNAAKQSLKRIAVQKRF